MKNRLSYEVAKGGKTQEIREEHKPNYGKLLGLGLQSKKQAIRMHYSSLKDAEDITKPPSTQIKTIKKERRRIDDSKRTQRKSEANLGSSKCSRMQKCSQSQLLSGKYQDQRSPDGTMKRKRATEPEQDTRSIKKPLGFRKGFGTTGDLSQYVLFGDQIVLASEDDVMQLHSRMEDFRGKQRVSVNIQEDANQFYPINAHYNEMATLIQKTWRGYHMRQMLWGARLDVSQAKQDILNQVSQLFRQVEFSVNEDISLQEPGITFSVESPKMSRQISDILPTGEAQQQQTYDAEKLSSISFVRNHQSLLQKNIASHSGILNRLLSSNNIEEAVFHRKQVQLERWAYIQRNQINYLKKMLQKQLEKSTQLGKMKDRELSVQEKLDSGQITKNQVQEYLTSISFDDQKYNFSYYLFPESDSAVLELSGPSKPRQKSEDKCKRIDEYREAMFLSQSQNLPLHFQEQHRVKLEIQQRVLCQMSYAKSVGFPVDTSIQSVNNFINSICIQVSRNWKYDFVNNINTVYGQCAEQRLGRIQGFIDEQEALDVVNYQVLEKLETEGDSDNSYVDTHKRAIFDAFNENINLLRPYYMSDGMPFMWGEQKTLTFYQICEENVVQVFDKIKYRVMRICSSLCGLQVPNQQPKIHPNSFDLADCGVAPDTANGVLMATRVQNLLRSQITQICQQNYRWFLLEEHLASVALELTSSLFTKLIVEAVCEMCQL